MQLAINQVVILIIGLVIFGLGLTLLFQVFGSASSVLPGVDGQLEEQLRTTLSRGDVLEMSLNNRRGGADDLIVFTYGIKNDPRITSGVANFTVMVSYVNGIDRRGNELCNLATTAMSDRCKYRMNTQSLLLGPDWSTSAGMDDSKYVARQFIDMEENEILVDNIGFIGKDHEEYQGPGQYYFNMCVCVGLSCIDSITSADITECSATTWATVDNPYKFLTFSATVE